MFTPWGPSQHACVLAPGIMRHSTASHGGIHLNDDRIAQIPDNLREYINTNTFLDELHWYEEDVDWALPVLLFENDIRQHLSNNLSGTDPDNQMLLNRMFATAQERAQEHHPDFLTMLSAFKSRKKTP